MLTLYEDLPNELIIEIFTYTSTHDIGKGFWNLNQRFNQLIKSLQYLSLVINKYPINEWFLFHKQIIRLVIVTLNNISYESCRNLRTLKLNLANENHLKQIQSKNFPNLIYLSITISFDYSLTKQITSDVFSNQFQSLRYADLGKIDMSTLSSWSQTPSLRSITILSPNINIIPSILQSCPQLIYFKVGINDELDLDLLSLTNLSNHPLKQFIFIQPSNSKFTFNITKLFYLIPNLKSIDLRLCTRSFIDLIEFLSKFMIYLKKFSCSIIEYPNKHENIDIKFLRNIHQCYSSIQHTLREDSFCLYTTKTIK